MNRLKHIAIGLIHCIPAHSSSSELIRVLKFKEPAMFSWARNLDHFEHAGPFMLLWGAFMGGAKRKLLYNKSVNMETGNNKQRGGRPKKTIKRTYRLRVACSAIEVALIKSKARNVQLTISEFPREAALKSQIVTRQKALPKEVLAFTAQLSHLAANINSMAYKNNRLEDFTLLERATFKSLAGQVKELAQQIKNYIS